MKHQFDPPGKRMPGPNPPGETPLSEVLAQRFAFLEISDADVERVRELADLFDSFLDGFGEQFFTHLIANPVTASFLTDAAVVARLKQAIKGYFESLFRARIDVDYVVDRRRIGEIHADVGLRGRLETQWFLGVYDQYLHAPSASSPSTAGATWGSISRGCSPC